jgi:hypothetical protein
MTIDCVKCGQPQVVSCTDAQYVDWKENNRLIQNAMPDVPKAERELLISGYCDSCFKRLFRDEEGE